jgi:hypothetical protein
MEHDTTEPTAKATESAVRIPSLRIEVLGRFHWSLDGRALPEPSPVGMAALSYLLVHAGESIRHEEMEALFTFLAPDAAQTWALEAAALGRLLPRSVLRVTTNSMRLHHNVSSDLTDATALLEPPFTPSALQRAWLLLRSEFLEGFSLSKRPIWDVWLRARRTRLRRHLVFVTEQLGLNAVEPAIRGDRTHLHQLVH